MLFRIAASGDLPHAWVPVGLMLGGVACANGAADNNAIVLAFLNTTCNVHDVVKSFSLYVGPTYTQHNPHVPDGTAGALKGLGGMVAKNPQMRLDIRRAIAEGDLVAVRSHWIMRPGDRGQAVIDIFRLANGKIVEHWDVLEDVPDKVANSNTMF